MATVLHSQLSQIQPPNSHHHHHHAPSPSPFYAPAQGHYFCKDCGVMFESSTSLEVHLSYHKENLLTRWASQDSHSSTTTTLDKSSSNSSSSSSLPSPSPQINHRADNNSSVDSTGSSGQTSYFTPSQAPQMDSSPQYLPPLYNNNTGDPHHLLPSSRFAPLPIDSSPGPGLPLFHAPENFHPNFHPLFSPPHVQLHGHDPHHQGQIGSTQPPPPPHRDTPAEILDLDSHKVHVYQHQQQQQQQGFFHRPYLPHLLPPPPGNSGWPQEPPPSPSFRFSPAGPYPSNTEAFYAPPPQQSSNGPNNLSPNGAPISLPPTTTSYDIVRVENPAYSEIYNGNGGQNGGGNVPAFGQPSPYLNQPPPQQQVQPKPEKVSPGAVPAPTKGQQKSPPGPGGHNPQGPPPGAKTKGWKGGECKRPKTYNCPACNKWFTSSGHLKRHYGTTLHKNSMKNLGENAEELLKPPPKGKKGAAALAKAQSVTEKKQKAAKNNSNGIHNNSPPMAGNNNNNSVDKPPMIFPPSHEINGLPPQGHNVHLPPQDIKLFHAPQPPMSSPNGNPNMNGGNGEFNPYGNNGGPVSSGLPPMNHLSQHSPHIPFTTANSNFMVDYNYNPNSGPNGGNHNDNNGYGGPPPNHNESNGNGERIQGPGPQDNGPLPPFSSVAMYHYIGGPIDPYARGTPPFHQNQNPSQTQQQISPQNHHSPQNNPTQPNENGPSFEGHFPNSEHHQKPSSPSPSLGSGDEMQSMSMDHSSSSSGGSGSESSSAENGNSKEVLKCPDCSKTFGRSCYLTQHANSSHSAGGKPFKCSTCGKRFPVQPALSSHEAKHFSEKPYKCAQCPKQFNHKTDLRRHECLHTGEKPYNCCHCGKGFIRKDHMTKHLETHRKKSALNNK